MKQKSFIIIGVLVVLSMILASCQAPEQAVITVIVEKEGTPVVITATPAPVEPTEVPQVETQPPQEQKKVLYLSGGQSEPPSIDPVYSYGIAQVQLINEMSVGLFRQNVTTGEQEYGLISDYSVSEDGLTYTFTILPNIPWVKYDEASGQVIQVMDCEGTPRTVTADDFYYGLMRTLDPSAAAEYAYVVTPYLKGAADYNDGTNTDPASVGVQVLDPLTIQYTFNEPAVYNLSIIGLWIAHAQPKWVIDGDDCNDGRGDRWTEQGLYVGYGPYTLKEWIHDYEMVLTKNPFWPGTSNIPQSKIDEIVIRYMDPATSLAEFEAGNLDVSGYPPGDFERIKSDPELSTMLAGSSTVGTEFYAFNTLLPPTDDVRVRLALSLAIDRQSILDNVIKEAEVAQFFTHPGAIGAPRADKFPDMGVKYDLEQAKALLNDYLTEKNLQASDLKIVLLSNVNELRKATAEAIIGMWKENLGINVDFVVVESAVFSATRKAGNENMYRSSWVQDYPDANNFLFETFGPGAGYSLVVDWGDGTQEPNENQVQPSAEEIDRYNRFMDLITRAGVEQDPEQRQQLYADAEQILTVEEAAVTPLYYYSGFLLIRPEIAYTDSVTGYDRWEMWDITR